MYKYLLAILLTSCGSQEIPTHPNEPIELSIENKNFKPLQGNSNLFGGLLCASGETAFCGFVYKHITPVGNFCRNESRVTPTVCTDKEGSFSTDEAYGVLLFIVANKDKALANKFWSYIKRNNYKFCTNANDDKCIIHPHMYRLMYNVWKYVKIEPTKQMRVSRLLVSSVLRISASKVEVSYRTHLLMVHFYIERLINNWSKELQATANILLHRQPNNLFIQYLSTGTFDKELFLHYYSERTPKMTQYFIQRSDSEQAWRQSVGWDFQLLKNLYNKD